MGKQVVTLSVRSIAGADSGLPPPWRELDYCKLLNRYDSMVYQCWRCAHRLHPLQPLTLGLCPPTFGHWVGQMCTPNSVPGGLWDFRHAFPHEQYTDFPFRFHCSARTYRYFFVRRMLDIEVRACSVVFPFFVKGPTNFYLYSGDATRGQVSVGES